MAIHWIDLAIIIVYLLGITGVGLWFSRHQRDSSTGYFLASRSLSWSTIGLALFATNISTVHLTGLAGAGFSEGMVFGDFEWLAPFLLILLGLVFAPFYFRSQVATLPEYLEGRYGPDSRTVLAVMAVVGALFIHVGRSADDADLRLRAGRRGLCAGLPGIWHSTGHASVGHSVHAASLVPVRHLQYRPRDGQPADLASRNAPRGEVTVGRAPGRWSRRRNSAA